MLAGATLLGGPPLAAASTADEQSTQALLTAQYRLVTALVRDHQAALAPERAAATQIGRECPGVVSGIPNNESPPALLRHPPPPRVRGENARAEQQRKTIDEELTAAVEASGQSLFDRTVEAYAAEVLPLSWSNPAIAAAIAAGTTARHEAASTPPPPFCADAKAWAQSGYRVLSAASRSFEASRAAPSNAEEPEGSVSTLLAPYENASDRALLRRISGAEIELFAAAATTFQTTESLRRILGFPNVVTEAPMKPVRLGRGRTAAGTRFEMSTGSGVLGGFGCRRSVTVAYSRPGDSAVLVVGGPNNPICISSPRYRHPALFCEQGIETIQTAAPASVRSVRLMLADGRTITSRVVRVSRRHGGPVGIYAQELHGGSSHAVSLTEVDAGGGTVLSVRLPRYRCVKRSGETEGIPTVTTLASGRTPEGEPFTISTLGSINAEPFIDVDTGVDPEVPEPTLALGAGRAFPWSLKIGCAPHPYAILYGILAPPGASVSALTPQGAVALTQVPFPSQIRAKGPLAYGVFSALPAELAVLGAGGTTVHTEDLREKATEAAQFCEGYAEP
jgi:hypothetical protein